jgi:hypothetical protein
MSKKELIEAANEILSANDCIWTGERKVEVDFTQRRFERCCIKYRHFRGLSRR